VQPLAATGAEPGADPAARGPDAAGLADPAAIAEAAFAATARAEDDPSTAIDERAAGPRSDDDLTAEEREVVRELQTRDAEVKRHEEAHAAVGGQYASAPTYEYQSGPDGKSYAVGGQVMIDTAPIPDDPDATIAKMQIVQRAALAPAEPSGQDLKVAQEAQRQMLEAMNQKQEQLATTNQQQSGDDAREPSAADTRREPAAAGIAAADDAGDAATGDPSPAATREELAAARTRRIARGYAPSSPTPPTFAAAA